MFNNLIRRLLRNFVLSMLTVESVQRVMDAVIAKLKTIAPDAIDELLAKIPTATLAKMIVDVALNLLLPTLPRMAAEQPEAALSGTVAEFQAAADYVIQDMRQDVGLKALVNLDR